MKDLKNLNPSDYLRVLWRRKWYATISFCVVVIAAAAYAWWVPNVYRSEAKLAVEPAPIPKDYVRPSEVSTPEEQISAVRQHINSRSFLERMIQEFQLLGYGRESGFSMDRAVEAVRRSIQVLSISKNAFSVSYTATDPQIAQSFTRRIVESLLQDSSSSRKTRAMETDKFLDEQLRQAGVDLAGYEEKIKQFKTAHLGALPEQESGNMSALNSLHSRLTLAENALQNALDQKRLIELRAKDQSRYGMSQRLTMPMSDIAEEDFGSGEASSGHSEELAKREAELAQLRLRYTAGHPDVVRVTKEVELLKAQSAAAAKADDASKAGEESDSGQGELSIPELTADSGGMESAAESFESQSIKQEIAKREREKASILREIGVLRSRLNLAPALEQELRSLSREYDSLKLNYTNLQNKKFQSQMTANLETNRNTDTYKIIDDANLPDRPAFPNRLQMILLGLGAGVACAIGSVLARELLDTTLTTEDEVTSVLKLPVLASVSEISKKEMKPAMEQRRH